MINEYYLSIGRCLRNRDVPDKEFPLGVDEELFFDRLLANSQSSFQEQAHIYWTAREKSLEARLIDLDAIVPSILAKACVDPEMDTHKLRTIAEKHLLGQHVERTEAFLRALRFSWVNGFIYVDGTVW